FLAILSRPDEYAAQTRGLAAADVGVDVVADDCHFTCPEAERLYGQSKEIPRRLADDHGLLAARIFEAGNEGADVHLQALLCLPEAVAMHAHELRAAHQHAEDFVEHRVVPALADVADHDEIGFTLVLRKLREAVLHGVGNE